MSHNESVTVNGVEITKSAALCFKRIVDHYYMTGHNELRVDELTGTYYCNICNCWLHKDGDEEESGPEISH